ncbi:hypothetical protein DV735_g3535, partial [Chaetothyriales sp. CBS 134920]
MASDAASCTQTYDTQFQSSGQPISYTTAMRPMLLVRTHAKRLISTTTSLKMAPVNDSTPHVVRTAHEPRQTGTWHATVSKIEQVNSTVRCFRLTLAKDEPPLRPLPGQYIDLHIPGISTVGGFTITSPPQTAVPITPTPTTTPDAATATATAPYIELAVQKSPDNPPAAYLWQPASTILHSAVSFQVGGRFTYPPPPQQEEAAGTSLSQEEIAAIENVVFVAGGVGINPIMSMIKPASLPLPEKILFEDRLVAIAQKWKANPDIDYEYTLFETGEGEYSIKRKSGPCIEFREGEYSIKISWRRSAQQAADGVGGEESFVREVVVVHCARITTAYPLSFLVSLVLERYFKIPSPSLLIFNGQTRPVQISSSP